MPSSTLRALAAGRMLQTGEGRTALDELRRLPPGAPPIPEAADTDQAALESDFLEVIGHCGKDRWRPHMLPFAVTPVTSRPDELLVRVPKEYLPDVLRDLLPTWSIDEEKEGALSDIYGIPGLRAHFRRGRIILSRPGLTGRVSIPACADRWRKAALIAAELCRYETGTRIPWLTHRHEWHPAEVRWIESGPGRYSPDSWQYRNTRFASQILRRLPGLCPAPRAYYHDLWFNRFGDTCSIQFEWAFGATHDVILGRLLDPVFGPGAHIALCDRQSLADCYSGTAYRVNVHAAEQPDTWISLRRSVWDRRDTDGADVWKLGEDRRRFRQALEQKHDY